MKREKIKKYFSRIKDKDLTGSEWDLLASLLIFMDSDGVCNPSLDRLAKSFGHHIQSTRRNIKSLKKKGIIEVVRPRDYGTNGSNHYRFLIPAVEVITECETHKNSGRPGDNDMRAAGLAEDLRCYASSLKKGGFVYCIRLTSDFVDREFYKFGKTNSMITRLKSHYTGSPFNYEIIATWQVDDPTLVETTVLAALEKFKVRSEWFSGDLEEIWKTLSKIELPPKHMNSLTYREHFDNPITIKSKNVSKNGSEFARRSALSAESNLKTFT